MVTSGNQPPLWKRVLDPFFGLLATVLALGAGGQDAGRQGSAEMLRNASAWPHAEADARIEVADDGLRVEVAPGRDFAIAAASELLLPDDLGRIRVQVSEVGGGAEWFVRLYGELRQRGRPRTVGIAQDETVAEERVFELDPRLRSLPDAPLQLQLGVEGKPGAFAVFRDVAFLPALPRPNREPRRTVQAGQLAIEAIELMPNLPEPYDLIDWREKARAYDRFVFDLDARGELLPLAWLDDSRINLPHATFGMPSYVGDPHRTPDTPGSQEGITCMGAVLGATLVGIDKSRQAHDYVGMCEAWFNTQNDLKLVLNHQLGSTGGSFWYEIWPHIVFYALADQYPGKPRLREILRTTADRWLEACRALADAHGVPDFNHTSFDFGARNPVDNGKWREPDAAAGVAWIAYAAWKALGEDKYLAAAEACLKFLEERKDNPYYEVLLPYGALVAARVNAELGRSYDSGRLLRWCFGISDCRGGWGVTVGNWGGYDCDGLVGSIDNRGGYAFAMNTFAQAAALVPLVRYDPRYARAIGKWMLNLANAARLFYPGALPEDHQTSGAWKGDPQHVVAYEGLRREWLGKSPCATGDPVAMGWGPKTDLGLYGSGYVGMIGSIVSPTDVPRILRLDCLATDFFRDEAFPTFLCYNPYDAPRTISWNCGDEDVDVYDAAAHRLLKRGVRGATAIEIPADEAAVIVMVPSRLPRERQGTRLVAAGRVVDFAAETR